MISYKWIFGISFIIFGFLYFLIPHLLYCSKECTISCVLFTEHDIPECIRECRCLVVPAPSLPRHQKVLFVPENLLNDSECTNGFSPIPTLELSNYPGVESLERVNHLETPRKPNIVLILLDDQDEIISPYMEAMPFSKELFVHNGTKFSNSFTATSICCPARCQLLTGLYAHNNGVLNNHGIFGGIEGFLKPRDREGRRRKDQDGRCINNEFRTIPLFLQKYANYKTGIFGKYINGIENDRTHMVDHIPPGWSEVVIGADHRFYAGHTYTLTNWKENESHIRYEYYGVSEEDYSTDVLKRKSLQFIERYRIHHLSEENPIRDNKGQKEHGSDSFSLLGKPPLFLFVSPTAPHFPLAAASRHKMLGASWASSFESVVSSRPSYYNFSEVAMKSKWLQESVSRRAKIMSTNFNKIEFVKRMGSLYAVDELLKAIYDKFSQLGELDNTIFVLASDNGYNLGSHMLIHKMAPYEESTRIPLWISGPGFKRANVDDSLVLLLDLAPTFLEAAGLKPPSYMDGLSIKNDEFSDKRDSLLFEYKQKRYFSSYTMASTINELPSWMLSLAGEGFTEDIPPYRAIRSSTHMLVEYSQLKDGVEKKILNRTAYHQKSFKKERNRRRHDPSGKPQTITIAGTNDTFLPESLLLQQYELYDMRRDPFQMKNLIYDEDNLDLQLLQDLKKQLEQLYDCTGQTCREQKFHH